MENQVKKSVVLIVRNEDGSIFKLATNEDGTPKYDKNGDKYGTIRVKNPNEVRGLGFAYQDGGIKQGASALINIKEEVWKKVAVDYEALTSVPGRVVIEETTTPEPNKGFSLKRMGKDGEVCCLDGQPIYRRTYYSELFVDDTLIKHNGQMTYEQALGMSTTRTNNQTMNSVISGK